MKKLSNNENIKKLRNPNIDCIRIIGMLAIVLHHLILHGKIISKYPQFCKQMGLLDILTLWHISSFGLISGVVRNKNYKLYNLFYLWIQVEFYSITFYVAYNKCNDPKLNNNISTILFPVINEEYWYFTAYFGMYPFLTFINLGILNIDLIEFKKLIYFIIGIFFIWSSYFTDKFSQNNGYSPISLLILFLIGTFLNNSILTEKWTNFYRFFLLIMCPVIYISASLTCFNLNNNKSNNRLHIQLRKIFRLGINSIPSLIQSISIIALIFQINFNFFISRIITIIGPLIFDVYLIHENPYVRIIYINNIFKRQINNIGISYLYFLILSKCIIIFIICIFLAYIRNLCFRLLKIKKFCYNIESVITKCIQSCF